MIDMTNNNTYCRIMEWFRIPNTNIFRQRN